MTFADKAWFELILVLVSLWLLVNSFKETFKEKRPIDFFDYFIIIFSRYFDYFFIFFKDILIIFLFLRYFDYYIIILLFFYLTEVTTWTIGWILF